MAATALPARSEIPVEYTWNAPSVFASPADWSAAVAQVQRDLPGFQQRYQGHLGDSPALLADYFESFADLYERAGKIYVYAGMSSEVDTSDTAANAMAGQAMGLLSQLLAAAAFANPEILAIGEARLQDWMAEEPRLETYRHFFEDLFRQQAHVRSAEVEEVFGMVLDPFSGVSHTASQLANADIVFRPATDSDGSTHSVEQGNFPAHLASPDRELRRTAWESYFDGYLAFKNTFASNLTTAMKQDIFFARARRHPSALEAALFPSNIPASVFHNLIDTFRRNLPTWHRYWSIRRRALGVDILHPYDVWAPLTGESIPVSYPQAVDWICEGLRPLGEDYVSVLRRGCLEQRWVDVLPNQGKRQGAFSSGWKGTYPFIMMSFNQNLATMSTLAHELGHSMHSYLTWQHQPMVYSDYSLFVAEVASNFNQAMVRAHLLATSQDRSFRIAVIEEAMSNFFRYFFIMPTLAIFELEMHERLERGEGVTAEDMIALMADRFSDGYGQEVHVDRSRVGITWATFNHLYANFYVFQYATGISAAHALAAGILEGQPGAADHYLSFLKAGSSLYPLDALKLAGVDMTTPDAVEKTFAILGNYVDQLEQLVGG